MGVKVTVYKIIFTQMKNSWDSGQDDAHIKQEALVEFQAKKGPFTYTKFWDLLRKCS
ncbi:hypothetical protein HanIR_Chr12g0595821 [Helianthus annuus]|nr:hypothetical protein HanIR_Chr12g0595821 [Helianthus annuus]